MGSQEGEGREAGVPAVVEKDERLVFKKQG